MTGPLWPLAWQAAVGLGCAAVGWAILRSGRARTTGRLLVVAALSLTASPLLAFAGQPRLANGLTVSAVLITIPLALLRVIALPRVGVMRWADTAVTVSGLAAAATTAAGLTVAGLLLGTIGFVTVTIATGLRFDLTAGDDRRDLLWIILGLVLPIPLSLAALIAARTGGSLADTLAILAAIASLSLPAAAGIAVFAPQIVDVRAVMQRLTVAAIMFALAAAAYIGAESAIITITGDVPHHGVRALIVVALAAAFHPVMRWVRTSVSEMLFGVPADPVETLTLLGTQLSAGAAPPDWLDALRVALAAPGAVLRDGERVIAASGELGDSPTARVVLRAGATDVGELVVTLATDDPRLARTTEAVLSLVSVPLAQALHAARLTEDLRVSRGQAVTALEEERRRVRRDLHDGLGPMLTGIAYSADAAANLLPASPNHALETLDVLRRDAREAIVEIRRIVYGLRPRALDELGLVGAVQQQVSRLRTADGRRLTVTVHAPRELPVLPAAVEVAAFRVAVEALTNVARHSGVAEASASFAVVEGAVLRVTVQDRGRSALTWTPGVGIASMRERVEQVRGTLTVDAGPDGATVIAEIPISP